jgi:hypothetical protein
MKGECKMFIQGIISGDAGHNAYPDTGASGYRQEDELTKELWLLVQSKLKSLGYTVMDCTPYGQRFKSLTKSLEYRCTTANASGSVFHLCIHFNAGGGNGVEAYAMSAKVMAQQLVDEIAKLGYTNRGVKDGSWLYVLKNTAMPCVLLECFFVDSKEDTDRYNKEAMANAIVKALTGIDIVSKKYYVRTGKFYGEVNVLNWYNKYFGICQRFYVNAVQKGEMYFTSQYLTKGECQSIVDAMTNDGLWAEIVEE